MPTVHLIYGYLGAGKTTFAKKLERDLPAVRYSPDEWMVRIFGSDGRADDFRRYQPHIYEVMNAHWPQVIACGIDVVLDYAFWPRWHRDTARTIASDVGAASKLYYLRCPDAVALKRCLARNSSGDDAIFVDEGIFKFLRDRFEPLGDDEPHDLIETG
jgi:predicted kinase